MKWWIVITTGPLVPMTVNPEYASNNELPRMVIKEKGMWNANDRKRANQDIICKNIFYQVIDDAMFNRIKSCKTAKEIWG